MRLDQVQIRLLRKILEATRAGVLRWQREDLERYGTAVGSPLSCYIHFKYPSYNGDDLSDRDFVEVSPAGRFMIGTPGWALALEILGAGLEEWRGHYHRMAAHYEWQIRGLEEAIRVHVPTTPRPPKVTSPKSRKRRTSP